MTSIRLVFLVSIFSILSCNIKTKSGYPTPDPKDINEIIQLVAAQDSLFPNKGNSPLSTDLKPVRLFEPMLDPRPEMRFYDMDINGLLYEQRDHRNPFNRVDSAYLMSQSYKSGAFVKIDTLQLSGFTFTTLSAQMKASKSRQGKQFTAITMPLFSLDQNKACVVIEEIYSRRLGGQRVSFGKTDGHWRIVRVGDP